MSKNADMPRLSGSQSGVSRECGHQEARAQAIQLLGDSERTLGATKPLSMAFLFSVDPQRGGGFPERSQGFCPAMPLLILSGTLIVDIGVPLQIT